MILGADQAVIKAWSHSYNSKSHYMREKIRGHIVTLAKQIDFFLSIMISIQLIISFSGTS